MKPTIKTKKNKPAKKSPAKQEPAKKGPTKTGPKKSNPKKKGSLLNPTPAQVVHRNRLWAKALLDNTKKARSEMYGKSGGRCCLAVAQDVAISCGVKIADKKGDGSFPEKQVADFFGWGSTNPHLQLPDGKSHNASDINDGDSFMDYTLPTDFPACDVKVGKNAKNRGLSHEQISICVLNTFVRPKSQKWTH